MTDWDAYEAATDADFAYLDWLEKRWHEEGIEPPEQYRSWLTPPPTEPETNQ